MVQVQKSSSKKSAKKITTAKEVKEIKSVPITVQLNILKVLINERSPKLSNIKPKSLLDKVSNL